MKFVLEIELGNDLMQTYADVQRAIDESFIKVWPGDKCVDDGARLIKDPNGNRVGKWEVQQ